MNILTITILLTLLMVWLFCFYMHVATKFEILEERLKLLERGKHESE